MNDEILEAALKAAFERDARIFAETAPAEPTACLPLPRLRAVLLNRHRWTPEAWDHVAQCRRCGMLQHAMLQELPHPSLRALATVSDDATARHLQRDACTRCLALSRWLAGIPKGVALDSIIAGPDLLYEPLHDAPEGALMLGENGQEVAAAGEAVVLVSAPDATMRALRVREDEMENG